MTREARESGLLSFMKKGFQAHSVGLLISYPSFDLYSFIGQDFHSTLRTKVWNWSLIESFFPCPILPFWRREIVSPYPSSAFCDQVITLEYHWGRGTWAYTWIGSLVFNHLFAVPSHNFYSITFQKKLHIPPRRLNVCHKYSRCSVVNLPLSTSLNHLLEYDGIAFDHFHFLLTSESHDLDML